MTSLAKKVLEMFGKPELAAAAEKQLPSPPASERESSADYGTLYRQMAEALAEDCWAIDPAWLLDHPERWEEIRALDAELGALEQKGASKQEYQAALMRAVRCLQDTRALCAQETRQGSEKALQ
ncbi:MAG TPA: hypothetical protein VKK81_09695 [Candidatus Binatia bacterium]|nr:hypothetical protein [Candidatus Binatia bacterium]